MHNYKYIIKARMLYKIVISAQNEPGYTADIGTNFATMVENVLNSAEGWRKYEFILIRVSENSHCDFIIELAPASKVKTICNTDTLSCYSPSHSKVLINYSNWMGNSVISQENAMTLDQYRTYVINHEVGHALGMRHPAPVNPISIQCDASQAGKPGSVMMQMSKGTQFIYPCTPNCWPLDKEIYDEMQNKMTPVSLPNYDDIKIEATRLSAIAKFRIKVIIMIIILCLILLLWSRSSLTNPLQGLAST